MNPIGPTGLVNMKNLAAAAASVFFFVSLLLAKPKPAVPVYVHIKQESVETLSTGTTFSGVGSGGSGSYSSSGSYSAATVFMNVTISPRTPDKAGATAAGDGQWCLLGDSKVPLDENGQYEGLLQGDDVSILVPEKNGKTKKIHFGIYDRKWRDLAEAGRLYKAQHP